MQECQFLHTSRDSKQCVRGGKDDVEDDDHDDDDGDGDDDDDEHDDHDGADADADDDRDVGNTIEDYLFGILRNHAVLQDLGAYFV